MAAGTIIKANIAANIVNSPRYNIFLKTESNLWIS